MAEQVSSRQVKALCFSESPYFSRCPCSPLTVLSLLVVERIWTAWTSIRVWKAVQVQDHAEGNAAELAFDVVVNESDDGTPGDTTGGNRGNDARTERVRRKGGRILYWW